MAISHTGTFTETSSSTSSLTVPGVEQVEGDLVVIAVVTRLNVSVTSISGGGGETASLVAAQCGARSQARLEVWSYTAEHAGSGEVAVTLASTATNVLASCSVYSGVDGGTPIPTSAQYNTLGSAGACSGGTDNNDATGTIVTGSQNSWVYAAWSTRNRTKSGTSNRVDDLSRGSGGDLVTMSVEDDLQVDPGTVTVGAPDNLSGNADWALVIAEIAESGAGAPSTPPQGSLRMMGVGI